MIPILRRVLAFIVRVAAVLVGLLFAAVLMVVAIIFIAWALLRGRRPQLRRFKVDPRQPFGGFSRRGRSGNNADVVDVEAREVPSAAPRQLDRS